MAIAATDLGFIRVDAKGATDGVSAEQKTLRSAQDFSALDIIEAGDHRAIATLVKVIFEKCGGGVAANAKVLGSDTPHTHRIDVGIL